MKLNERQACQILGLAAPTTVEVARKAYRRLAQELHPDRGGDEERFKQVSVAYQYLVDYYEEQPQSRRRPSSSAQTRSSTQSRSRSSQSSEGRSNAKPKAKSSKGRTRSQDRSKDKANKQAQSKEDHREAWRAWREQVDRASQRENANTRGDDIHREERDERSQSDHYKRSAQQSKSQPTDSSPPQHEVIEASVVPGLGDTLKRWGEVVGDRVTSATNELGGRFNKWYRKSARSLFERGQDEKLKLNIDLTTAIYGKQVRIAVQRLVACPDCQHEDDHIRVDPNTPAAQWAEGCQRCGESGRITRREELSVYVPPGGNKGDKLKVNDKGGEGLNGSPSGHLYLLLTPTPLPQGFRRNGADVELTQLVSADLLARGGVLTIKTLRGSLNIRVPTNFQSGKKLMVPAQGFPLWSDPDQVGKLTICLKAIAS